MTEPVPRGLDEIPEQDEAPDEAADFLSSKPDAGMDSAADPKALKNKRRRIKREQTQAEAFWHQVMGDQTGRAVVWDLLSKCETFIYPSGVTPQGYPDTNALMFHLGKQAIGKSLYEMLAALDREAILKMHDEHDPTFIAVAKTRII